MKTKDRILLTSLKMFNEQGERNVSTNHIAAALNISPGNLYYHFRNKNEIVYQLFLRYQEEVQSFMIVPEGRAVTYQDKVNYLEAILNSMWDYRFLHRDLQHLLQDDERLRSAYREFSSRTVADGRRIFQSMADAGVLLATDEQIDALILNVWVLVVSWSSFLQSISIQNNDGSMMRKALLKRAIYQIIALEEPYLCESMKPMLPELKKKYLSGESSDPLALFPTILDDVQQR
ncbi:MAG: TetR family transcriptional regulator [Pseudomonadales bacterium]|nr:TetR family transcriptional regulator [Pseudomonadales bacterium]